VSAFTAFGGEEKRLGEMISDKDAGFIFQSLETSQLWILSNRAPYLSSENNG
jgi:hypothetical protein